MLPLGMDTQNSPHSTKAQLMRSSQRCRASGPPQGQMSGYPVIWRPWILTNREIGLRMEKNASGSMTSFNRQMSKGALGFQHPVRLFMPKSRTQEYLSHLGKKVLASFPVQATLHFYNDDSSSEEEEEDAETEQWTEEPRPLTVDHLTHSLGSGRQPLFWKQVR